MKRAWFGLVPAFALALAACASIPYQRITIDIPALSPVAIEAFREIVVTEFAESGPDPDLKLGPAFAEYLETEMRRVFKGTVSRKGRTPATEGAAADMAYWKSAGAGLADAVFLAGIVGLVREPQKALRQPATPKDGPFDVKDRAFFERTRFTLTFEYLLINATNGRVIQKNIYRETRIFPGVEQTAEFALFDFLPIVKSRLFAAIFGKTSAEQRYLLIR
jgi:hypothetical protein